MNFIVNLNKPSGISSQQAVTRVKRLLAVAKAGHTGTLDPMATGVLLVCLNEATKVSRFFLEMDKKYRARVKIGERTDTYDAEGMVTETGDISAITEENVVQAARVFVGRINQKPPMYSAVKVGGEALYKLARKGIEIERAERPIEIYDLRITEVRLPFFEMEISCSKGTYIRTLCDDIGSRLGTGAHMVALERTGIGNFDIKDSVTLDELGGAGLDDDKDLPGDKGYLCGPDEALSGLTEIVLNDTDFRKAMDGVAVACCKTAFPADVEYVRLKGPSGNLFGIGKRDINIIRVERILKL